ncbi:g116 [Coccomyxa viridis]|uniref:G116 protein n=1 Tax=Coccomyxa viridis TaxID=1274662 RepID=A0ABP1FEX7_9CHLO
MDHAAAKDVLRQVFGSDSDDDDTKVAYPGPSGLKVVKGWLCPYRQENLLAAIAVEEWFAGSANQAMRFGGFPAWAEDLAEGIRSHFDSEQLAERQPLFDQLIANKYRPGEGLKPHVDLMRFQDGVAIVSLQAAATLSFTKGDRRVNVLLLPGDLLLLEGEARYEWMHGITAEASQQWQDRRVARGHRISVTLRKLREDVFNQTT